MSFKFNFVFKTEIFCGVNTEWDTEWPKKNETVTDILNPSFRYILMPTGCSSPTIRPHLSLIFPSCPNRIINCLLSNLFSMEFSLGYARLNSSPSTWPLPICRTQICSISLEEGWEKLGKQDHHTLPENGYVKKKESGDPVFCKQV